MATDTALVTRYHRQRQFSRDAAFIVLRPLKVNGVELRPGDVFDTSRVSVRTHRNLFAQRKIDEVGGVWHKISGLPYPGRNEAPQINGADPERAAADVPAARKGRKGPKSRRAG